MKPAMVQVKAIVSWIWKQYDLPHVRTTEGVGIAFTMQTQEKDHWCWAAVASSVSLHFNPQEYRSQKEIVAKIHGFELGIEPDGDWDLDGPILDALKFVHCFRTCEIGQIRFRQVVRELQRGRPVVGHIDWGGGEGHAIAVSGCRKDASGGLYLTVRDPAVGSHVWAKEQPMEWVLHNYCDMDGKWVGSYFVKA